MATIAEITDLLGQLQAKVNEYQAAAPLYTQADMDAHNLAVQASCEAKHEELQAQVNSIPQQISAAVEDLKAKELIEEQKVEEAFSVLRGMLSPAALATQAPAAPAEQTTPSGDLPPAA